jgi:hypothetical protein
MVVAISGLALKKAMHIYREAKARVVANVEAGSWQDSFSAGVEIDDTALEASGIGRIVRNNAAAERRKPALTGPHLPIPGMRATNHGLPVIRFADDDYLCLVRIGRHVIF